MRAVRGLRQTGGEPVTAFGSKRVSADQVAFAPGDDGSRRQIQAFAEGNVTALRASDDLATLRALARGALASRGAAAVSLCRWRSLMYGHRLYGHRQPLRRPAPEPGTAKRA